ncbi:hypothetical protein [Sphingomonas alba]|uniref:site-specific DNA-methyltransferase (cytosine-N(4)-specific) n=1 Tax=Sphingomonas alba TaxID=2908208 RepID=A0ABT0RNA5_9SPHN|nr:hypothetical protein [Sphingomonas alba]MCL6684113.1 hypothetical protein [Sphingomonas alba]
MSDFGLFRTADEFNVDATPNPKPGSADKRGYGRLASLYTAFSLDFARFALELCTSRGHASILDPFAGMGTLGEAGRQLPISLTMNDLNPFAATACAFRTAESRQLARALKTFHDAPMSAIEGDDYVLFSELREALTGAPSFRDILQSRGSNSRLLTSHILALFRIALHRRFKGSNPTWTKRAKGIFLTQDEVCREQQNTCSDVANFIAGLKQLNPDFRSAVTLADTNTLQIEKGSVEAIITSPPYPNRTDYIRHYLPAVELLLDQNHDEERGLRESQIGTPLIRASNRNIQLPRTVVDVIDRVREHGSYASERYYAKGYSYYFEDMQLALSKFRQWLSQSGRVILVIQDVYYKELRIGVGDLFSDMAKDIGLRPVGRRDFVVRNSLARLSPHSRAAPRSQQSCETVLVLAHQ